MFCKYCGSEIADDAVFCPSCGKDVTVSILKKKEELKQVSGNKDAVVNETSVWDDPEQSKPGTDKLQSILLDIKNVEPEESENDNKQDAADWYYQDGTVMDGPLTYDILREKILDGSIDFEAKVKEGPNGQWLSLSDSPFRLAFQKVAPTPVFISDKWIWCMAILPILVTNTLLYFGIIPSGGTLSWALPFALNVGFFILDKKELQDKGFIVESWMWLGFIIIPVYLIVREVKTNHNFVPFIIWCFMEALLFIL